MSRRDVILLATLTACGGGEIGPHGPGGDAGVVQTDAEAPVDGASPGLDASAGEDGGVVLPDDPWSAACPWMVGRSYARPNDPFFEPGVVVSIDLEMDPADYEWLLQNPDLEEYRATAVTFCGERLEGAGLRFKRSTHPAADLPEGYPKSPMLIDFSEFAPGQKLRGLRHINLEYGGDQMLFAERLNWEVVAASGAVASRANHALLTLNGSVIGVFTNVERVDRSYALTHFGDDEGNLYKHAYCGTFYWEGSDPAAYLDDPQCYSKHTNEEANDYGDLVHFIDVLNNTSDDSLEAELPTVLAVDDLIVLMATLQTLGYADTPNANANNFYTYHAADDRFHIAPWDLDGGFWAGSASCEHPADTIGWDLFRVSSCYPDLPLFRRIVDRPAWRTQYLTEVSALIAGGFSPEAYAARVDELEALLVPALAQDPNRDGDDAVLSELLAQLVDTQRQRVESVRAQLAANGF